MKTIHQQFNWHDVTGKCKFFYGKGKNLEIDGTGIGISCFRYVKHPINSISDSIELTLSVVIGKVYEVRLCDENLTPIASIIINELGWILYRQDDEYINTGLFLTRLGYPVVDPDFYCHYWYPEWSDQTIFRFSKINFSDKTCVLTLISQSNEVIQDGDHLIPSYFSKNQVVIPLIVQHPHQVLTKVNLCSSSTEGTLIRLKSYRHISDGKVIDYESFPIYWEPIFPNPDGYPSDNICELLSRPIENRWLEVESWYGFLTAKIPLITEGEIELVMMADNVDVESVVQIGSYKDSALYKSTLDITIGILENSFRCSWNDKGYQPKPKYSKVVAKTFAVSSKQDWLIIDEQPYSRKIYKVRVKWSAKNKNFNLYIDDLPIAQFDRLYDIPLNRDFVGVDAVSFHPGWAGARMTLSEKKSGSYLFPRLGYNKPQKGYFGDVSIVSYEAGRNDDMYIF
jgi:hypothetical protein